jgi:hypothetical protein
MRQWQSGIILAVAQYVYSGVAAFSLLLRRPKSVEIEEV